MYGIMDKILTIIIPTYNMEDYLHYCLDSLLIKDNFKQLEILVVNDGSKDHSSVIAHEYERAYPGVFRVIDKENGNYGSCVNRGLEEACGKYVKVLDADDSFDTANFEKFVAFLIKTDADLILSDFAVVNPKREIRKIIGYHFGKGGILDLKSICNESTFGYMQMHAVTYRRENLLELDYKQTEGISYTDQQWIFLPMIMVKSVACFERFVYKYLIGRAGQTVNPEVKVKSMKHTALCVADMIRGYECHKKEIAGHEVKEYLYARMIPLVKDVYVFSWSYYNDDMRKMLIDFDRQLKKLSQEVYELIGSKEISSFMGFRYIDYWRKNQNINLLLMKMISKGYITYLRLKQMLRKPDEMAVPTSV